VSLQAILAYFFVLVLIYVLFRLVYGPLRLAIRVAYRTLLGALLLWGLNLLGNVVGYHLPLNLPTAMTAGLLGVPGLIVIIILHQLTT
jgi:inhibitor of the pro-sigma K processing machinery